MEKLAFHLHIIECTSYGWCWLVVCLICVDGYYKTKSFRIRRWEWGNFYDSSGMKFRDFNFLKLLTCWRCDMLCGSYVWEKQLHVSHIERFLCCLHKIISRSCRSLFVLLKNNKNSLKSHLHIFYPFGMAFSSAQRSALAHRTRAEMCWEKKKSFLILS